MIQFTYTFCISMLHSLWQAALLMLLYVTVNGLTHKNNAPLAKRNFLYIAIMAQLVLFIVTFLIYFSDATGFSSLAGSIQTLTSSLNADGSKIITPWVFGLYLFIIAGKLFKAFYTWYRFKQQFKAGLQKPGVDLKLFTQLKAYQFGIKRKVNIWLSSSIQTPVTFGYFKPVILLPVALLSNISTRQAETLILHELTHIRTNDYLLNWFLVMAETLFFFNPFVTSLCKKIKLEREKNCDVNVLSFQYSPALYAETLLLAERMKQQIPVFQMAAVNRKKHLLQRIQFFTSDKVLNQTLRFNIVAPLIGLVLLFMLSAAILFQSHNSAGQLQSAAGLHFIPSDNYIIPNTEFTNPVNSNIIMATPVVEINKKSEPAAAQKKTINTQPIICKPAPESEEEIVTGPDFNFARPITVTENDATRQIIIREEGSGSASVKLYNLSFVDGKWILQPEWVVTADKIIIDSITTKIDSLQKTLKKIYPTQQ